MSRDTLGVVIILVVAVLGAFFLTDWPAVWDWFHTPRNKINLAITCWVGILVCIALLVMPEIEIERDKS